MDGSEAEGNTESVADMRRASRPVAESAVGIAAAAAGDDAEYIAASDVERKQGIFRRSC